VILLYTFLACLVLYSVQAWILPKILVAIALALPVSGRLVEVKATEGDAADLPAKDLRRTRAVARLSRFGVMLRECVSWLGVLFIIYLASEHWGGVVSWNALYGLSILLFLSRLNYARTL